jgi:iron complex transport system substrate-binding protein
MELDDVTGAIVDASIAIHRGLGPGLLESVYEIVLGSVLERRGLQIERQHAVSFSYDGILFEHAFRVDLLVARTVIVEVKSIERLAPVHAKQVLTYLRLMDLRAGFVLNFGAGMMREGIRRVVNDLPPSWSPHLRINNE